ncbi:NAD(P)/FAD-dependent oxidoreductase [Aspergillus melleus]|uniref:NAD(P)/FAD-dependent oxidoreductase n=1 Tax=Aspergillus melleus TaxID=138277 RepID=UPI001E8CF230|nr:uncharacterized protein LDX57_010481 [Aspergillus melleus]KAH8432851.1 hypothetical protein LDX57_010481 [Aspergillus melleus]
MASNTPHARPTQRSDKIIIIGGGLFGLTTALELRKRGYEHITVLDRTLPPAPDASSHDTSRLIRPDYADPFYSKIAYEAMEKWEAEWSQYFNKSGLAIVAHSESHPYIDGCKNTLTQLGKDFNAFNNSYDVRRHFPDFSGGSICGYENKDAGWVDAAAVMKDLAYKCISAGVSFITGPKGTVSSLVVTDGQVTSVRDITGGYLACDRAILATGSWTNYLLDLQGSAVSACQPVGYIQLSPEEAKEVATLPVVLDFTSGFLVFPPTADHVLKVMRHGYGYETSYAISAHGTHGGSISGPRLIPRLMKGQYIPPEADEALRAGLERYLPQFKDRPWAKKSLCWYTDTVDGNFIIGHHPRISNLFLATGGSGHAFKFLPVLGKYVVDGLENALPDAQRQRWAFKPSDKPMSKGDGSRAGPPRRVLTASEQARL